MQKKRYAALTMARDENFYLPIWYRYYSQQFGAENLFVIDHNSQNYSAKSILPAEANVVRIPFDTPKQDKFAVNRMSFDHRRFLAISKFIQSLLTYYDCVIFNDSDEIYVVDDSLGLSAYLDSLPDIGVRAGAGIELFQHADELSIDPVRPILDQRKHFSYRWEFCKPFITSENARIGAHSAFSQIWLDPNLMLVHLRFADATHLRSRQNLRLEAYAQNRGGKSSRWKHSLPETKETIEQFWQRSPTDLDLPHRELWDRILPDYLNKPLCDENYPRFGAEARRAVRPHEFFDPKEIAVFNQQRFRLPDRFKQYAS